MIHVTIEIGPVAAGTLNTFAMLIFLGMVVGTVMWLFRSRT